MQIAPELRNEINRKGYDCVDFSFPCSLAMHDATYKNVHNYLPVEVGYL